MKMIYNGNIYTVKIKKIETNSNYNHSLSVFRNDEKLPICGTTVKGNEKLSYLKEIVLNMIKSYENTL